MLYQLMYKDEVVLEFDSATPNRHEVVNPAFLPVGIQNGMTLDSWLRQRRADKSRVSIRKLFATLKMNFGDDEYISQFRRPTDFWWVRKSGSNDVFDMPIEDLYMLSLNLSSVVPKSPRTYEAANIGSYEKGWRSNKLYKHGNGNEILSELIYARISEKYTETASYSTGRLFKSGNRQHFAFTKNFVDQAKGEYLVLADEWTGTGPEEDFENWFKQFNKTLTPTEIESFKIMHFLDVVLNNFDRHCQNFGFVYNEDGTRRVAPNFDFNLSIIGYNGLDGLGSNEIPVTSYFETFSDVSDVMRNVPDMKLLEKIITTACIGLDLESTPYLVVADWIINRWEQLI